MNGDRSAISAADALADLAAEIDTWLGAQKDFVNADQFAGILRTLLRLAKDNAERGDLKILNRALQELRRAFSIFAPYRHVRKVSIFGSARSTPEDPNYDHTRRFAAAMAERGWMVITGAGPGIMAAGHEGAGQHRRDLVHGRLRVLIARHHPGHRRDPREVAVQEPVERGGWRLPDVQPSRADEHDAGASALTVDEAARLPS